MRPYVLLLAAALSLLVSGNSVESGSKQPTELIPWWSVNAGGSIRGGSGSYWLSSSVGQSITGKAEGAGYIMHAGFWNPAIAFVGVEERVIEQIPKVHSISQNYPNPFYRSTTLCYAIPKSEPVKIEVFNIAGQSVRVLVDQHETPGYKSVSWDGRDENGTDLSCGVYFYRITSPEFQATRKMLLLR